MEKGVCKLLSVAPTGRQSLRLWCTRSGGVPPRVCGGIWGWWQQCFLWTAQQWHLVSQVSCASSRGMPYHRDPHWHPLCCIYTTNNRPLPRSSPLNPCFSTQPSPALAIPISGKGCPGLVPRELDFLNTVTVTEVKWYFIVVVIFIYLKISNVEHLLMYLLVIHVFRKCLFTSMPIFNCIACFFIYWVVGVLHLI